jgi:hypothetical protein
MEDLRVNSKTKQLNKNVKISNIFIFIGKHWLKILLILIALTIIIFPEFSGSTIGHWLNTLVNSFLNNFKI